MILLIMLIIFSVTGPAFGAENNNLQIGFATLTNSTPYKGAKDKNSISPLLIFEYGNLYFDGEKLGYNFYKKRDIELHTVIVPGVSGYKSSDSKNLGGMAKRKDDFSAGVNVVYQHGTHTVSSRLLFDINNNHNGYTVDLKYSTIYPLSAKFITLPYLGVEHFSANKSNYYYGVDENEAISTRSSYTVGGIINPYIGMEAIYQIDEKWSLLGRGEYKYLNDNIKNSPIVEQNSEAIAAIGVLYSW
ncbi:MAG: MipA/OmpV family protein [Magnetococcales bacterium]|nr:MipA/OmpV family protein [Magnetococcales bacterium]